jgi:hypothetical protein
MLQEYGAETKYASEKAAEDAAEFVKNPLSNKIVLVRTPTG